MMTMQAIVKRVYNKFIDPYLRTYEGMKVIKALRKRKKDDEIFLIMSNPIGDCVYGMAYADALRRDKNKKLVIFSESRKQKLFESYQIDAVFVYLDRNSREWKGLQRMNGSRKCVIEGKRWGIYNVVQWVVFPFEQYAGVDALYLIREKLFDLDESAKISFPHLGGQSVKSIKNFDKIKSRIAVINPFSTSMTNADFDLFNDISLKLREKGYVVFTNVLSHQNELDGSLRLDCPLEEFFSICNQIPLVVSVRSGIIDLAISAKTNFFVLYFFNRRVKLSQGFHDQYLLTAWRTNNVEEIIYKNKEQSMNAFHSFLESRNL